MVSAGDIEKVSLFRGLTHEELKPVADVMTSDTFPEGHVIYQENETGCPCIYIIRNGKIDVCKKNKDGDGLTLSVLREGDFFGEFSFFDNRPHSASTIAAAPDTVVISLQRPDFERAVEGNPMIGYKILTNIILEISSVIRKMNTSYIDMAGYMFGRTKR